ncbi:MAG: TonB family protein [Crocinitomix sp.]|jgi:TonB family protein
MKNILFFVFIGFVTNLYAQEECEVSNLSDHYVLNNTVDTVIIWVNNRNQVSFSTDGPEKYEIAPDARVKIAQLEWAGEFREPTGWYVFKVETSGLTPLCDKRNWIFEQLTERQGEYTLTLVPASEAPCEAIDEKLYFTNPISLEAPEEEEGEIYEFVEKEAQFMEGASALYDWINDNLQYPQKAIEESIAGNVYVEFVVEKSGELSNVKILRSPNELLSAEAIRLVDAMPKWEPGQQAGRNVRVRYRLPIVFRLD